MKMQRTPIIIGLRSFLCLTLSNISMPGSLSRTRLLIWPLHRLRRCLKQLTGVIILMAIKIYLTLCFMITSTCCRGALTFSTMTDYLINMNIWHRRASMRFVPKYINPVLFTSLQTVTFPRHGIDSWLKLTGKSYGGRLLSRSKKSNWQI